jgi:hypothetical protein
MEIVGAIFQDETSLNPALDALQDAGFDTFMVFGPDDFSGEPGIENDEEGTITPRKHTAAGTVSGISVNPPPEVPDAPSTETIEDELMAVGLLQSDARSFIAALQQDHLLLLVQTASGDTGSVTEIIEDHDAQSLQHIQPGDAFPEELWLAA